MLSLQTKAEPYQYWFERIYFETGTNNCSTNRVLKLQRLHLVTANQSLTISVLVWTDLVSNWNQKLFQQPCSSAATTPCCHCQPKLGLSKLDYQNVSIKIGLSKLECVELLCGLFKPSGDNADGSTLEMKAKTKTNATFKTHKQKQQQKQTQQHLTNTHTQHTQTQTQQQQQQHTHFVDWSNSSTTSN